MSSRPDYQNRVIQELTELSDRLKKLEAFLDGPTRPGEMSPDEERRLTAQRNAMRCYRDVLEARIEHFPPLTVEQEIQVKGLTAPRITEDMVKNNIRSAYFFTAKQGVEGMNRDNGSNYCGPSEDGRELEVITFCVLILRNGFKVVGDSAPVSVENFDPEVGRLVARENAESKIWALMGYELKCQLQKVKNHG
jgi:hypothetical protein